MVFNSHRAEKLKLIKKRWTDYSSKDIDLHKPLPEWRQILEDIEFLSEADLIEEAYQAGHRDAQADYENGYADGYDEAVDTYKK